jgi:hypothetical protein
MTPELLVRGATAKEPHIKRVTSKVVMFAQAWLMWKMVYIAKVPTKIGRRPISSEPGPQNVGPAIKANEEEGGYKVAYFPRDVEVMRDSWHRRGWGRRSERVVRDNVSQCNSITSLAGQVDTICT